MTNKNNELVPVWTLATTEVSVTDVLGSEGLTPARLSELRTVLAALADSPIATLEMHPMPPARNRKGGIPLDAASPLATQLAQLVSQTAKSAPQKLNLAETGEVLYTMVVPAKVASQVGSGLVTPMVSKTVAGGVHSALRDSHGIVANATFVPVACSKASAVGAGAAGAAGAATGSAATAGVAVASAGALTVAAPLVLMAVAVGVSAHAEQQRQEAIERITDLLEQLHEDSLDKERNELDGSREAIDKATSILLDKGKIGFSLGLDSSVHGINTAIAATRRRLKKWEAALDALPDGAVEVSALKKSFPGVTEEGGTFRAHLEIARLAIALKRRVLVLQAVDHAQQDTSNPFTSFIGTLRDDGRSTDELESGITEVLHRLANLELKRDGGFRLPAFTPGEVDQLLQAAYRLRALGDGLHTDSHQGDVAIEMERNSDGSLVVFPAIAA
ncbi:hypothetical protein [Arthrobacter sp. Cr_A7]|uniref:hypothetical protein n=1 Tax=Arthrobacter sp. Cr_A7 TaxID=3031017 RepID=UPI0023DB80F5|nr:hypothetical protein [Arthrobacter sp. Cr_A7]MDF2051155.1 hypothetical protein [Arthrobacter sp. Cr_A7]